MTFFAPPTIKDALSSVNFAMAVTMLTHCAASSRVGASTNARVAASALAFFFALVPRVDRPPPRWRMRSMIGRRNAAVLPP